MDAPNSLSNPEFKFCHSHIDELEIYLQSTHVFEEGNKRNSSKLDLKLQKYKEAQKKVKISSLNQDFQCIKDFNSLRNFLNNAIKFQVYLNCETREVKDVVSLYGPIIKKVMCDDSFSFCEKDNCIKLVNLALKCLIKKNRDFSQKSVLGHFLSTLANSLIKIRFPPTMAKSPNFISLLSILQKHCKIDISDKLSAYNRLILKEFSQFFFYIKESKEIQPSTYFSKSKYSQVQPKLNEIPFLDEEYGSLEYYCSVLNFINKNFELLLKCESENANEQSRKDRVPDQSMNSGSAFLYTTLYSKNALASILDSVLNKSLYFPESPEQNLRDLEKTHLELTLKYHSNIFPFNLASQFNVIQKTILHTLVSQSSNVNTSLNILEKVISAEFLLNNQDLLKSYETILLKKMHNFLFNSSNLDESSNWEDHSFGLILKIFAKCLEIKEFPKDEFGKFDPVLDRFFNLICKLVIGIKESFEQYSLHNLEINSFNLGLAIGFILKFHNFVEDHRESIDNYLGFNLEAIVRAHRFLPTVRTLLVSLLQNLNESTDKLKSFDILFSIVKYLGLVKTFRDSEVILEQERIDFLLITSHCLHLVNQMTRGRTEPSPIFCEMSVIVLKRIFHHLVWLERVKEQVEYSEVELRIKDEFLFTLAVFIIQSFQMSKDSYFFDLQRNQFKFETFTKKVILVFCSVFADLCKATSDREYQIRFLTQKMEMSNSRGSILVLKKLFFVFYSFLKQGRSDLHSFIIKDVLPMLVSSHNKCKKMFFDLKFIPLLSHLFKEHCLSDLVNSSVDPKTDQASLAINKLHHFFYNKYPILFTLDALFAEPLKKSQTEVFKNLKSKPGSMVISLLEDLFTEIYSVNETVILSQFYDVIFRLCSNGDSSLLLQKTMITNPPNFMERARKELSAKERPKIGFTRRRIFLNFIKRSVHSEYLRKFFCRSSHLGVLFRELNSLFDFEFDTGTNSEKENQANAANSGRGRKRYTRNQIRKKPESNLSELDNIRSGNAKTTLMFRKFFLAEHLVQIVVHLSFYEPFQEAIISQGKETLVSILQNLRLFWEGKSHKIIHFNLRPKALTMKNTPDSTPEFFKIYLQGADGESMDFSEKLNLLLLSNLCLRKPIKMVLLKDPKFMEAFLCKMFRTQDPALTCFFSQVKARAK